MLTIFVSCLGGAGVGGLCVMWRFLTRLSLGWQFYELFSDLRTNPSDQELRVLVATLTADSRLGPSDESDGGTGRRSRRGSGRPPRELAMESLGIDRAIYWRLFTSALEEVNAYFEQWS